MSWILTHFNIMPYIPQKILDIIIGYATAGPYTSSFSNCASFVSHSFHQIVLPYKFRSLTFRNRSNFLSIVIPIPKFCEAINAGDAHAISLAPLVQDLSLFGWIDKDKDTRTVRKNHKQRHLFPKLSMEQCITSPRHHGTTWQACTTSVVVRIWLRRCGI